MRRTRLFSERVDFAIANSRLPFYATFREQTGDLWPLAKASFAPEKPKCGCSEMAATGPKREGPLWGSGAGQGRANKKFPLASIWPAFPAFGAASPAWFLF